MNYKPKLVPLITVILFAATLVIQRSRISELKIALEQKSAGLQIRAAATYQTTASDRELEEMIMLLKAETADLHRLRNEVAALRSAKPQTERLRQENVALQAKAAAPASSKPASIPKDLILDNLKDAGLTTPQAAVETFFWAMCKGDLDKLFQACPMLEKEIRGNAEAEKAFLSYLPRVRAGFTGYNFVETEYSSPTSVEVKLLAVSGKVMKIPLQLNGAEWKVKGLPE